MLSDATGRPHSCNTSAPAWDQSVYGLTDALADKDRRIAELEAEVECSKHNHDAALDLLDEARKEVERLRERIDDVAGAIERQAQFSDGRQKVLDNWASFLRAALEPAEVKEPRKGKYVHPCPHCGKNIRSPKIETMMDAAGDDFDCPRCGKTVYYDTRPADAGEED